MSQGSRPEPRRSWPPSPRGSGTVRPSRFPSRRSPTPASACWSATSHPVRCPASRGPAARPRPGRLRAAAREPRRDLGQRRRGPRVAWPPPLHDLPRARSLATPPHRPGGAVLPLDDGRARGARRRGRDHQAARADHRGGGQHLRGGALCPPRLIREHYPSGTTPRCASSSAPPAPRWASACTP